MSTATKTGVFTAEEDGLYSCVIRVASRASRTTLVGNLVFETVGRTEDCIVNVRMARGSKGIVSVSVDLALEQAHAFRRKYPSPSCDTKIGLVGEGHELTGYMPFTFCNLQATVAVVVVAADKQSLIQEEVDLLRHFAASARREYEERQRRVREQEEEQKQKATVLG